MKEGLVLPLDCVHQRAARAEKEAQRAYKLRRRAEELAAREGRRDAFRRAGSTMVRAGVDIKILRRVRRDACSMAWRGHPTHRLISTQTCA